MSRPTERYIGSVFSSAITQPDTSSWMTIAKESPSSMSSAIPSASACPHQRATAGSARIAARTGASAGWVGRSVMRGPRSAGSGSVGVMAVLGGDHTQAHTLSAMPLVRDVILRDGSVLRLREPTADDEAAIKDFFDRLAPPSRDPRFYRPTPPGPPAP